MTRVLARLTKPASILLAILLMFSSVSGDAAERKFNPSDDKILVGQEMQSSDVRHNTPWWQRMMRGDVGRDGISEVKTCP